MAGPTSAILNKIIHTLHSSFSITHKCSSNSCETERKSYHQDSKTGSITPFPLQCIRALRRSTLPGKTDKDLNGRADSWAEEALSTVVVSSC
ncbi:hypothetical protein JTE90_005839 [Oedothorax gibbosus]|uniref:Uncharacterized protein n=1 Tax=Oedothorax gibbosus TaxID=931172 RepID=A0AAV6V531_9ARAC|nr:hypothetical protein JTE90_005839 [Oedothorax gibbosus]